MTMDAISLDEWELLPDNKSSFMEEYTNGHGTAGGKDQLLFGTNLVMINMDHFTPTYHPPPYDYLDEDARKPLVQAAQVACVQDPFIEFKDTGVVHTESRRGEFMSKVSEILISDAKEEEMVKCPPRAKEVYEDEVMVEAAPDLCDEHEGVKKDTSGFECVGFSVGKLRVSGVGALCSFGVAAATFCIFLLGGRQQQQQQKRKQNQSIHLHMYAADERIQQVVQQQACRFNQAMSSVMGGGASTRASISFGGYYDGF